MSSPYPLTSYTFQNPSIPSQNPRTVCLIGQSNISGAPGYYTGLENYTIDQVETIFGSNQHITRMLRAAIKKIEQQIIKPKLQCYVKADDGSGVAATRTLTITGTATTTAEYILRIDSDSDANAIYVPFTVTQSDSPTTIAASIAAAVTAVSRSPMTATSALGVVTLTAVNKGTQGNQIGVAIISTIPGISIANAAGVTGATNPSFADIVTNTNVLNSKIDFFVCNVGYTTTLAALETLLNTRGTNINTTNNQDYSGILVFGNTLDVATEAATLAGQSLYQTRASGYNVVSVFNKKLLNTGLPYYGNLLFCSPDELATDVAVCSAICLTTSTSTNGYLINQSEGRPANCKIPIHNTSMPFSATPLLANYQWTAAEIATMEGYRFGLVTVDSDNNPIIGNLFTLANVAQYATYELRWQFFICRELFASQIDTYLAQKVWNNGNANDQNETDRQLMTSFLKGIYEILNGVTQTSILSNYYSGILDNSDANFANFSSVIDKTLSFNTVVVSGLPRGILTVSLFLTPTLQINLLQITQINNLVSQ